MRTIGSTQVSVFPLCLGSNIFGWTVDDGELRRLSSAAAPVTAGFDCRSATSGCLLVVL